MSAQVLEFRPRGRGPAPLIVTKLQPAKAPVITTVDPWWACPVFCQDTVCHGGEMYDFGTHRRLVDRRHGALIHTEAIKQDDGGYIDVSVSLLAVEDPDHGFMDGVAVLASLGDLETTDLDAVRRVAVALESAAWHAAQPLHSRSASGGVGRATNLEAS